MSAFNEDVVEHEMAILREAHARPTFAMLWGVEAAEVPHNRFLHHLLDDSGLGVVLLRAMLAESSNPPISPDDIRSIGSARFQLGIGDKYRLDEVLVLDLADASRVTLIVEMRVEAAEGDDQLADYLHAWRIQKTTNGEAVCGLLLRFTEEPGTSQPTLTLSGFCAALKTVLGREGDRVPSATVLDYYRTCRMLLARERILLAAPSKLMAGDLPSAWLEEKWRWACERLLRGVDAAMMRDHGGRADEPGTGVYGVGVARGPNGAYLDFCNGGGEGGERSHNPGMVPGFAALKNGKPLARGFFKLRAQKDGLRLEAQILVESYPKAPPAELEARHRLSERLTDQLQGWNCWEKPSRSPGSKQKSGCAAVRKMHGWMPPEQLAETAWAWAQEVLAHVAEHGNSARG